MGASPGHGDATTARRRAQPPLAPPLPVCASAFRFASQSRVAFVAPLRLAMDSFDVDLAPTPDAASLLAPDAFLCVGVAGSRYRRMHILICICCAAGVCDLSDCAGVAGPRCGAFDLIDSIFCG